jgi:PiT family inorganic phosphate transporter
MSLLLFLLILAIFFAFVFDVINGFHDAANSIATVVSTRVLTPGQAVIWAAFFNFVPMFIFAPKVANTISNIVKVEANDFTFFIVVCSGLAGAIIWDLLTWVWGLPTSSSHALIGGLAGAGLAYGGIEALHWQLIITTVQFIVLAPVMGFVLGYIFILMMYWIFRNKHPANIDAGFRKGQLLSAALYSIGHGANDAQKTMGVILALLISTGYILPNTPLSLMNPQTFWIILLCHLAMSLGTMLGGWRIVKTMGMKITKIKPIGGFCAETAGALTLFMATHLGIPVSTTHTITGAIIGTSSAVNPASHIKWGIAARIVWAWVLTIPASAVISAAIFYVTSKLI